ncbi:hypothetical protein [Deinococcus hohokamensis]|uniref:Uncharacterized protein n=1 Tax=Deinococcus hohokamensis TaxID=309883 RepID=A0ABV9I5T8_9DEIO
MDGPAAYLSSLLRRGDAIDPQGLSEVVAMMVHDPRMYTATAQATMQALGARLTHLLDSRKDPDA